MQRLEKNDIIMPTEDGWLICPVCRQLRRKSRIMQIRPDTRATKVVAYCRNCKTHFVVDIDQGQCFESPSH